MMRQLSNYTTEAAGLALIEKELASHKTGPQAMVISCPEGSRADCALMQAGSGQAWPIQLKTTRRCIPAEGNRNRQFQFSSTMGYKGCLVVCCALLADETLVWLIPGKKLESVSALTLTENGKWDKPFAVTGDLATSILDLVGAPWWKACSPHDTFYFKPQTQTRSRWR